MKFRVGQKVVCVDPVPPLTKGRVYTVLGLGTAACTKAPMVYVDCKLSGGWYADRFRPIVNRKTSIEIFRRLLVPSKQLTNHDSES